MQTKPGPCSATGSGPTARTLTSCFNKVIPALQADGYDVMAAQYGLDTNEGRR
jgi:hypothetical protein